MARTVTSRSGAPKKGTSSSYSRRVATHSISSLLGGLDETPDADIRSYTVDELRRMRAAGSGKTRSDAEEIELDDSFWAHAKLMPPLFPPHPPRRPKASVHLRLDPDVLEWFKRQGKGHLTRMNSVLRAYYEAQRARTK